MMNDELLYEQIKETHKKEVLSDVPFTPERIIERVIEKAFMDAYIGEKTAFEEFKAAKSNLEYATNRLGVQKEKTMVLKDELLRLRKEAEKQ